MTEFPHTHGSTVDKKFTFGLGCYSFGSIGINPLLKFKICLILLFFGFYFARSDLTSLNFVYYKRYGSI